MSLMKIDETTTKQYYIVDAIQNKCEKEQKITHPFSIININIVESAITTFCLGFHYNRLNLVPMCELKFIESDTSTGTRLSDYKNLISKMCQLI